MPVGWYNQDVRKLGFIGESPPPRAKPIKSFRPPFSKGGAVKGAEPLSPRARGETPTRSKRHRRVNFKSCKLLKEGNRTSGGFPFLYKGYLKAFSAFLLTHEAQRKKLSKKETPRKISPRARGDQRSARWIGASL